MIPTENKDAVAYFEAQRFGRAHHAYYDREEQCFFVVPSLVLATLNPCFKQSNLHRGRRYDAASIIRTESLRMPKDWTPDDPCIWRAPKPGATAARFSIDLSNGTEVPWPE
jgi:hypothetical protein